MWTENEVETLRVAYCSAHVGAEIKLDDLARLFNRNKANVCRKARSLGLTDNKRPMLRPENRKIRKPMFSTKEELAEHLSKSRKKWIAEHGHPRGALGMKHTDEAKKRISEKSSKRWKSLTEEQKGNAIVRAAKTRIKNGTQPTINRANASWGAAWREIGGIKKYYRSKWEANYARYLEWLKSIGEIQEWKHEPETFWFDGIKRGCLSYLPDFRVVEKCGAIAYHEVKGWFDDRSKTKIKRMAIYHPKVKLIVIDSKAYYSIKKTMQPILKDWETDSKGR